MTSLTKQLLLSVLLAASASGPVYADADAVDQGNGGTECTAASSASEDGNGFTDPNEMAGPDRATTPDHRFAASSPIPWQPGNPFRDDTAA